MKKRIIAFLLTLSLLAGVGAAATAGSAEDPLVSRSFADDWGKKVVGAAVAKAKTDLDSFGAAAIQASKKATVSYPKAYTLSGGTTMELGTGASLVLASGAAKVSVHSGTLVNATMGTSASSGALNPNQQYIVCENSSVTVTADSASVVLVSGTATTSGGSAFLDVSPNQWFYPYVNRGVELGLIHGVSATSYAPDSHLSVAAAITLAAQMHWLDQIGNTTIPPSGSVWYDTYRNYCIEQGIIDQKYASYTDAQMNADITRGEFVHIFYHALPEDHYTVKNQIADDAIPDVKLGDAYAEEVYAFYRAGILAGYTDSAAFAEHAFGTDSKIKRSEVAVIVVHMMEPDTRVSFTI